MICAKEELYPRLEKSFSPSVLQDERQQNSQESTEDLDHTEPNTTSTQTERSLSEPFQVIVRHMPLRSSEMLDPGNRSSKGCISYIISGKSSTKLELTIPAYSKVHTTGNTGPGGFPFRSVKTSANFRLKSLQTNHILTGGFLNPTNQVLTLVLVIKPEANPRAIGRPTAVTGLREMAKKGWGRSYGTESDEIYG